MLRTPLCDLLGIEVPVIQAAIAPFTSPELVAAAPMRVAWAASGRHFGPSKPSRRTWPAPVS